MRGGYLQSLTSIDQTPRKDPVEEEGDCACLYGPRQQPKPQRHLVVCAIFVVFVNVQAQGVSVDRLIDWLVG